MHYCYTWRCTANIRESNFCACWRQEEISKKRVGRIRVDSLYLGEADGVFDNAIFPVLDHFLEILTINTLPSLDSEACRFQKPNLCLGL